MAEHSALPQPGASSGSMIVAAELAVSTTAGASDSHRLK